MTRLDREARVTIKTLVSRGTTNTGVARLLGVTEGSVRYHVSRMVTGAIDGRGMKPFKAAPQAEAIEHWRQSQLDGALNLAALHTWLVAEHGYDGSLRSVQRFWASIIRRWRSGCSATRMMAGQRQPDGRSLRATMMAWLTCRDKQECRRSPLCYQE